MWVEAKNENLGLINVAHYYNIRPGYNRVVATSVANEEDVYLFHGEPEEVQAAYARIRDALARGERFVSLRETEPPTRLFGPEAAYALERLAHGKEVCGLTGDEAERLAMDADDESIRVRTRVDASNPDLRCVEPW